MISKNDIKYYSSLLNKKYRERENKFLVEGTKITAESLNSNYKCEIVFVTPEYLDKNKVFTNGIIEKNLRIEVINNRDFLKLSDTVNPQGIAAVLNIPALVDVKIENLFNSLIVCLENISDPGNTGTIIRNSDWFGINDLILSKNCAEIYNPKTIRASMGSIFHVNLYPGINLPVTLSELKNKGFKILCADLQGLNIFDYKLDYKSILIFSNEANGPTPQLLNIADNKITIPKFGKAESLNVASASAVILGEFAKNSLKII